MKQATPDAHPLKIAVIGGGISGMGAAHLLADTHSVTLFEAAPRIGGHARTVLAGKRGDQPVDMGFIVFNHACYPHLTALFERLEVPIAKSNMSFGVSIDGGRLEYALSGLSALFAQKRNLANPRFLRMVRDILHFNKNASRLAQDTSLTIAGLLAKLGTGDWFRDYYLLPFSGAIWSVPKSQILDFPAFAMVRFFENHALLSHKGQHQWYTVEGGSIQYVNRLVKAMTAQGVDIRLGAEVQNVARAGGQVQVTAQGAEAETFDHVIFATHCDEALALLADPREEERVALGGMRYQPNQVTLHCDPSVMPKRRITWSSWVYTEAAGTAPDRIAITYWMNSLQPIPQEDPLFVTLNNARDIPDELIHDQVTMAHPVYDQGALDTQTRVRGFNGTQNTWYCGAWMKNGFHEDGLASAVDVVDALKARQAKAVAA